MIVVNATFRRSKRGRRGWWGHEWKNVQGVQLDLAWEGDHKLICDALRALPDFQGYELRSYSLVTQTHRQVIVL